MNNRESRKMLLTTLDQLARLDPQTKEKCSQDAGQLASYMVERLKDQPPVAGATIRRNPNLFHL
ncbi:hypothetical protein [Desulfitobacterium hafniense]|uniref:hypothetical protein n=1 Tax=Desulfitobacterium hafniense TaxID=49338 RepID=UPI001F60F2CD|nr:hypothetical protein [Desulfitobacterium hafniense]